MLMIVAAAGRGRDMDIGGGFTQFAAWVGSAIMALFGLFRMRERRQAKQLELTEQWQATVLARVRELETTGKARDEEIDAIEKQLQLAQNENLRLRWRYDDLQEQFMVQARQLDRASRQIADLESDRKRLEASNLVLKAELDRFYREIQAGYHSIKPPGMPQGK